MRDYIWGTLIVGTIIFFFGWMIWFAYQHPCIQYQAVFIPGHYETAYHTLDCGKDCQISIPYQVWEDPRWTQQCVMYGDRSKGDIEANDAPIPAEKGEK